MIDSLAFKVQGKLTLTAPLASATWAIGETRDLTWDINQGNVANVKILGSKGGTFDMTLATDAVGADTFTICASCPADNVVTFNAANPDPRGKGKYTWTLVDTYTAGSILSSAIPGTLKIRVQEADANYPGVVTAASAAMGVIGQLTVTTPPAAGAAGVWRVGDTDKSVTWVAQGQLGLVKIELDPDGAGILPAVEITDPAARPNASAGSWSVSGWTPGGKIADYKTTAAVLTVTKATGGAGTLVSGSSGAFAIYPKITAVTVVPSPGDTGIWRTGETGHEVQWAEGSSELDFVDLLYSLDGGAFTLLTGGDAVASGPLTGDTAGTKTTTGLTVPTTISTSNVIIRVRDDDAAF
ncbi:MAG: hypothetical protein AAB249_01140, partial [Acidobacteriota bacterium]